MHEFHVGGPVPVESAVFVERSFQQAVRAAIVAGDWVLLLGPRQHGKTSAVIRLRSLLRSEGFLVAAIDMQELPPCATYEALLEWWAGELANELGVSTFEAPTSSVGQLRTWIEKIVPAGGPPIVVLIDEASGISDDSWRNGFFGQLRAIANRQASVAPDDVLARLRFVFIGTFRPESLVSPNNSPFNVCTRIMTDDITRDQALELWQRVSDLPALELIDRVYGLVGGQPYLLQLIYSRLVGVEVDRHDRAFEEAVEYLESGRDEHFASLFSHVIGSGSLSSIVRALASGPGLANEPANYDFQYLDVLGIAKVVDGSLVMRNVLYGRIASASTQLAAGPVGAPAPQFLIPLLEADLSYMTNELAEIGYRSYIGAVAAYGSGAYRLALAGFGSSLEAVLIDLLTALAAADLASAVSASGAAFNQFEDALVPSSYRLINLFKVAKKVPRIRVNAELSQVVRDWRNMIHPAVALKNYLPEEQLRPEAQMASALVCMFSRDLKQP